MSFEGLVTAIFSFGASTILIFSNLPTSTFLTSGILLYQLYTVDFALLEDDY
jgi:hypothetical protein